MKNTEKMYRIGNQKKSYPILESFIGFVPAGFHNWEEWNGRKKRYPCDITLKDGNEEYKIFLRKIIIKDALPMSFLSEERAEDWDIFAICSLTKNDQEFIIPLYPYQ